MEQSFKKHLSSRGISWVKPDGGFFYWLDFGKINTTELFKKAIEKKVAFVIGEPFCVRPGSGIHNARINFTFSTPAQIEEGVDRLVQAIDEMAVKAL
ncbi:hypothetical protein SDC9_194234 [bioreactor metagenome]|uniref:Aminotransferase class I/classII large domain-containing protein n=1 Tax=bioreactor metagenome TaxID=1076179 RepID=A0A645IH07_9ZZZZ